MIIKYSYQVEQGREPQVLESKHCLRTGLVVITAGYSVRLIGTTGSVGYKIGLVGYKTGRGS